MKTPQPTFGFPNLAQKFAAKYGEDNKTMRIEMKYSEQIREFVEKIKEANKEAESSTLNFR